MKLKLINDNQIFLALIQVKLRISKYSYEDKRTFNSLKNKLNQNYGQDIKVIQILVMMFIQ